jgi:hypothetical protein
MFYCIATKPLNDRTDGFRFNILGLKGLTRKRQHKSNGFSIKHGESTLIIHLFKRSVYFEHASNRKRSRRIRHFAG